MTKFLIVLIGLALSIGCAQPSSADVAEHGVSIDPAMGLERAEQVRDALDAWCLAVGWCPQEVAFTGPGLGAIVWDPNYSRHGRQKGSGAFNDGVTVWLNAPELEARPDMFWLAVAHELGHYGIEGHTKTGLMAARQAEPLYEIDPVSARAFH